MSELFASLLNKTFTIQRISRTAAGHGNFPKAMEAIGTVSGRIRPANSRERETAAQEGREITHVLYVAGDADIGRGDQVTSGDLTVEVLGVRPPSISDHHLEVDCLEIQKEVTGE